MIRIRRADERGRAEHGWLSARFSFSFAGYQDPEQMGFRTLRVLNDDTIQPAMGFDTHGHRDMEIVTYVFEGALEHRDSMGNGSVLRPGDVQHMSAGRGVRHSEFNHSPTERLRLLQIWILPETKGIEPGYEERFFSEDEKRGRLRLIVSPEGEDGALRIHQDARIHASVLDAGDGVEHELAPDRHAWIQVIRGSIKMNGHELRAGDGAATSDESRLGIESMEDAEFLLFDLG